MNFPSLPPLRWLITFAGVFASGAAGFVLPSLGAHLSLPLLPSGIAVAACIRWGRSMWPAIFAAGLAVDLWTHQSLVASLGVGVGIAAAAVATGGLLEWRRFDPNFSRAGDVPLFIVAAASGMILIPTLGLLGMHLAGDPGASTEPQHWIRWWSNATAGVMLVGPLLVAMSAHSLARFAEHWLQGSVWLLLVVICCGGALSFGPSGAGRLLVAMLALLLIVVGAIRFGLVVAAFGAFVISVAAALSFAFGRGVFGQLDELAGLATIWSFSAGLTSLGLIIIALLAERDAAGLERSRAERRYRQIFDGSPQPLWVHDSETLTFLLVNEATVRQYGWSHAEFLSLTVSALAPSETGRVLPPRDAKDGAVSAGEPFETRHRTRDGRVLAVEVWTRSIDLGGRTAELVFAVDVTERRALGGALIDATANEQRRLGREMHDGLGQELTGLALSARALATRAERDGDPVAAGLIQIASLARGCIEAARRIAQGLSPLIDADGNLPAALQALAARSCLADTTVRFRSRLETAITVDMEARNHLYRIAQEAVQNALKHADARSIEIELGAQAGTLILTVKDDGVGFPAGGSRGTGLGMRIMRFRSSAMDARLLITSPSSGGTTVTCVVAQPQPGTLAVDNSFH